MNRGDMSERKLCWGSGQGVAHSDRLHLMESWRLRITAGMARRVATQLRGGSPLHVSGKDIREDSGCCSHRQHLHGRLHGPFSVRRRADTTRH
eukprot:scaffold211165_cov30-Tisochrysis_lutea.AAC.2